MQPRDRLGRWASTGLPADIPTEVCEPVRPPDPVADVGVPVLQSVAVAGAAAIAALLAGLVGLLPTEDVLTWAAGAAGGVFVLALWPMLTWARATVWRVTTPVLPEPERPPTTVRLELAELTPSGGVQRMRLLDLPVDDERLRQFARAALDGHSLAVNRWAGRTFSRSEFDTLADELTRAGLVTAPRGNQPRRLTAAGRAVLRRIAD